MHVIEYAWLDLMRTVQLYAYRLPSEPFRPFIEPEPARGDAEAEPSAHVTESPIELLGPPLRVGSLFALHDAAGIELRVVPTLWPTWEAVVGSSLGFSGIRLRNARPPDGG